jgi:hypothetical protein
MAELINLRNRSIATGNNVYGGEAWQDKYDLTGKSGVLAVNEWLKTGKLPRDKKFLNVKSSNKKYDPLGILGDKD